MSPQGCSRNPASSLRANSASLHWISMANHRTVIPKEHIEKLLDGGYVRENGSGPILTDLGLLRLVHERNKQAAAK